jgi:hypothetical protein
MKSLLLMGGLLGFTIGWLFSWAENGSESVCLWHACLAAYFTAMLMKWWGAAWRKGLVEAMRERQVTHRPVNISTLPKANKS